MSAKQIPVEIRQQVEAIVQKFNEEIIRDPNCSYSTRYRGRYLYLDRDDYGTVGPIFRLTFHGEMSNWDFAIFKYSNERYDPDEWMFPGSEHIDGTVEGAMRAGLEAYS